MEIKQQLRLAQQLVMTPQLQQAIKLLQMSRMELVDLVREEMLENPVLEDQLDVSSGAEQASANSELNTIDVAQRDDDAASREQSKEADKKTEEIDWERYLENHAMQAPQSNQRLGSDDEQPNYEATFTRGEDLSDHLAWQIRMSDLVDEEKAFASLVVGNLDEHGYLKLEGMLGADVVPKLAEEAGLDPEDAEEVLKIIQHFDPLGVASRDLRECLLVQAHHFMLDELVLKVIGEHLSHLEKRNFQAIAKALAVPVEEVYDVAQAISDLEPRPGRNFIREEPRYITPDVYVQKVGEDYFVQSNDDGMPRLKISNLYRSAIKGDAEAKEYVQGKLRSAQWLIRSIDQRRKTIVKVTECIVEKQRDFFDKGIQFLRPMILRDVAEALGMHESTISRVTSNKYVHTPQGTFELKYFFNSAIRRDNNDDIASESVKQAIKKIIGSEETSAPYSDQKIVEILAQQDIVIARRTVAKYREILGILSSSKRKKYY